VFNEEIIKKLQPSGAVGVIPTDTVYGLVARAEDSEAVARLYALKHREQKPGTLIATSIDQLVNLGIKRRYLTAVAQFWPGAISVIIPAANPNLTYLHQGKMSLAIRIPDFAELSSLLEKTGPLLTTSANEPGKPTAETIEQAKAVFGDRVDFYVNGGDLSNHQSSTIIRIVDDAIEIIREGAVKIDENGRRTT
jgi:tRNA threonylcarbamoyl adenosine modification protein (Sua5/YciO/YrdC/YwlC family)